MNKICGLAKKLFKWNLIRQMKFRGLYQKKSPNDNPEGQKAVQGGARSSSDSYYLAFSRDPQKMTIENTDEGFFDICIDGVELGSYGTREIKFGKQKYFTSFGTGVAEPRTSSVFNRAPK